MLRLRQLAAMIDGRALVLVVVFGGLFTLQSSNALDPAKVAYLLVAAAAVAVAMSMAPWWLSESRVEIARPWLISSAAFVGLLIVSLAVSRAHGTPATSWLRDAAPYALFASAPILALACARSVSRAWLISVFAVCGSLASLSFTVEWLGRRQLIDLPIDRIVLPAGTLASGLLALATALALAAAWRRSLWAAGGGAVLGLFFITGTRSTLILLIIPVGLALLAGRPWRPAARALLIEAAVAVAVFLVAESTIAFANGTLPILTPGQASPSSSAPDPFAQRVQGLGTLLTDPGSDQSFQERVTQTKVALQAFSSSPIVGVGPGYAFEWTDIGKQKLSSFTLDTPFLYLAKFGLLGLVPLGFFAAAYLRLILKLRRTQPRARVEFLAVAGFALVLVASGILNVPMEDKGASFALIFVVALGARLLIHRDLTDTVSEPNLGEGEDMEATAAAGVGTTMGQLVSGR